MFEAGQIIQSKTRNPQWDEGHHHRGKLVSSSCRLTLPRRLF